VPQVPYTRNGCRSSIGLRRNQRRRPALSVHGTQDYDSAFISSRKASTAGTNQKHTSSRAGHNSTFAHAHAGNPSNLTSEHTNTGTRRFTHWTTGPIGGQVPAGVKCALPCVRALLCWFRATLPRIAGFVSVEFSSWHPFPSFSTSGENAHVNDPQSGSQPTGQIILLAMPNICDLPYHSSGPCGKD